MKRSTLAGLGVLLCPAIAAQAAVTDIANSPMASSSVSSVKPNIMFILDDSGSMAWDYLPDAANFASDRYGNFSNHCNGLYYNPATTYAPPVDASGNSFPNASFTSAKNNGFSSSSGSTNLTGRYYYT